MKKNVSIKCEVSVTESVVTNNKSCECKTNKAQAKLEALKAAGVNVDNLFAMTSVDGAGIIARFEDGKLEAVQDNDPIFNSILNGGTVPEANLYRRWVMAQTFHMLASGNWTQSLRYRGYEYSWKMMIDELHTQCKISRKDRENFEMRNAWFNRDVAIAMCQDYFRKLTEYIDGLKTRKCKGEPYKRIKGYDYFVNDIDDKIFAPLRIALRSVMKAKDVLSLYMTMAEFNNRRISLKWETPTCSEWVDAYKGCGAYYTLQNLIRFHGMKLHTEDSLEDLAMKFRNGEGYKLLGLLKDELKRNNIDVNRKIAEWRK